MENRLSLPRGSYSPNRSAEEIAFALACLELATSPDEVPFVVGELRDVCWKARLDKPTVASPTAPDWTLKELGGGEIVFCAGGIFSTDRT